MYVSGIVTFCKIFLRIQVELNFEGGKILHRYQITAVSYFHIHTQQKRKMN